MFDRFSRNTPLHRFRDEAKFKVAKYVDYRETDDFLYMQVVGHKI